MQPHVGVGHHHRVLSPTWHWLERHLRFQDLAWRIGISPCGGYSTGTMRTVPSATQLGLGPTCAGQLLSVQVTRFVRCSIRRASPRRELAGPHGCGCPLRPFQPKQLVALNVHVRAGRGRHVAAGWGGVWGALWGPCWWSSAARTTPMRVVVVKRGRCRVGCGGTVLVGLASSITAGVAALPRRSPSGGGGVAAGEDAWRRERLVGSRIVGGLCGRSN